jgi:hypothetical protein
MSTMPPIRYPLPTLVAVMILTLLVWRGEAWTRSLRSALAARMARVVEGPPIPHSDRPQVVAGPIIRRALLLHDDVPVAERPGGPPSETIRHRMFVDIYDVWPLQGAPEYYRVGNRKAIGWIRRADLLPWDTRLVIRGEGEALPVADAPGHTPQPITVRASLPVLEWGADYLSVAIWDSERPWSEVERRAQVNPSTLATKSWGLWLSREELLALLRRSLAPVAEHRESATQLRLRALLGRLLDDRPLSDEDVQAARAALPSSSLALAAGSPDEASDRLARLNEKWLPEGSWGGLSFQFVPLEALP